MTVTYQSVWTSSQCLFQQESVDMSQLEHFEAIEKRFWSPEDICRANSNYVSGMPSL